MRAWLCILVVVSNSLHAEQLLKPITPPGPQAANGLQATLRFCKYEFGPGESILSCLQITNTSDTVQRFEINKNTWYDVQVRVRRNGRDIKLVRGCDLKDMLFKRDAVKVEPGTQRAFLIDLRELDWRDPSWCDGLGLYEVQLAVAGMETGWTRFRSTAPGEKRPEVSPEMAEHIGTQIAQLRDTDPARHNAAYAELRRMGKAALSQLEDALGVEKNTDAGNRLRNLMVEIAQPKIKELTPILPRPPVRPNPPVVRPQPQPPLPPPDLEF